MLRPLIRLVASAGLVLGLVVGSAHAAGGSDNPALNWEPEAMSWSFDGPFGTYDRAALQRGFQVFEGACMTCHSMRHLHYRNLTDLGFTDDEVKGIARGHSAFYGDRMCSDVEDTPAHAPCMQQYGQLTAASAFPDLYGTEYLKEQGAETYGVVPPDLSLMAKARAGGPDYIRSLLIGYFEDDEGNLLNHYYPGGQIAMAPPLVDDLVEFSDGTPATEERMATDVAHFLMWAAEPKLEERKRLGARVMMFLLVLAGVMYAVKRWVWADLH